MGVGAYPQLMDSLINSLSPETLISTFGFIGVLAILFMETGLLVGILFPGDSLLFLAGLAASGAASQVLDGIQLPIVGLLIGAPIAVITGSQTGYFIGHKYGKKLFDRPNSRFFNQAKVEATQKWLLKYGLGKALFLARFTPFVRTLINPMCGIIGIPKKTFFLWNSVSAIIWADGIILAGYFLGETIKDSLETYLLPVTLLVLLITTLPILFELFREWRTKKEWS
jgi:membrane-associated protein